MPLLAATPTEKELAAALVSPRTYNCLTGVKLEGEIIQAGVFTERLQSFPTAGTRYIILSTGQVLEAPGVATEIASTRTKGLSIGDSHDILALTLTFKLPPDPGKLSFDWKFAMEESPEYINEFPDYFVAAVSPLGGTAQVITFMNTILAEPLSNQVTGDNINPLPPYPTPNDVKYNAVIEGIQTTAFDLTPFAGQEVKLIFMVADVNDAVVDSAVFLDNLRIEGCECPNPQTCAQVPIEFTTQLDPPAVRIDGEYDIKYKYDIAVQKVVAIPEKVVIEGYVNKKVTYTGIDENGKILQNQIMQDSVGFHAYIDREDANQGDNYEVVVKRILGNILAYPQNIGEHPVTKQEIAAKFVEKEILKLCVRKK